MLLLLVRHGDAGQRDPSRYPDDTKRPLTRKGRKTLARVCRVLRRRDLYPQAIISSPWARAWQSAEVLADEIGEKAGRITDSAALTDSPDLDALGRAIGERGSDEIVALVGHEPWMSELGSLLMAGAANQVSIDFPKAGVLALSIPRIEAGAGQLRFLLRPKMT